MGADFIKLYKHNEQKDLLGKELKSMEEQNLILRNEISNYKEIHFSGIKNFEDLQKDYKKLYEDYDELNIKYQGVLNNASLHAKNEPSWGQQKFIVLIFEN